MQTKKKKKEKKLKIKQKHKKKMSAISLICFLCGNVFEDPVKLECDHSLCFKCAEVIVQIKDKENKAKGLSVNHNKSNKNPQHYFIFN